MIDNKNNSKYKKLVAVAEKPFWFADEIKILEEKHCIAAFILAICRLEGMCYRLACKVKSLLILNPDIRFQDKELERLTFGRLLKEISKMNLEIGIIIDCKVLSRIDEIIKLRNKIIHNFSKNINIDRGDVEEDVKRCLPDTKKLYYKLWKDYVNNPMFSKQVKTKLKK